MKSLPVDASFEGMNFTPIDTKNVAAFVFGADSAGSNISNEMVFDMNDCCVENGGCIELSPADDDGTFGSENLEEIYPLGIDEFDSTLSDLSDDALVSEFLTYAI